MFETHLIPWNVFIEKWKIFRPHFLEWLSSQLQNEGWEREWSKSPPESFNGFLLFLYYILVVAYSLFLGIKYSPFKYDNWIAYSEQEQFSCFNSFKKYLHELMNLMRFICKTETNSQRCTLLTTLIFPIQTLSNTNTFKDKLIYIS